MTDQKNSQISRARLKMIRLQQHILILIAISMTTVVVYQIVARIGGFSVRWTEELARFLSIWATFLAVPILIASGRLINIDFFYIAMPTWLQRLISYLQILISIAAFLTLIWIGFAQVQATWHQTSPGLLWPMGLFTLPVVVCSILSIFVTPDWLTFNQRFEKDTDIEKYL